MPVRGRPTWRCYVPKRVRKSATAAWWRSFWPHIGEPAATEWKFDTSFWSVMGALDAAAKNRRLPDDEASNYRDHPHGSGFLRDRFAARKSEDAIRSSDSVFRSQLDILPASSRRHPGVCSYAVSRYLSTRRRSSCYQRLPKVRRGSRSGSSQVSSQSGMLGILARFVRMFDLRKQTGKRRLCSPGRGPAFDQRLPDAKSSTGALRKTAARHPYIYIPAGL